MIEYELFTRPQSTYKYNYIFFLSIIENRKCRDTELRCNSTGRCVPWAWVCDKEDDCKDGTDESIDQDCIPYLAEKCGPERFMCANKQCILAVSIGWKTVYLIEFLSTFSSKFNIFFRNTIVMKTTTVEIILMNPKTVKNVLRIIVFCVKMKTAWLCRSFVMEMTIVEMVLMSMWIIHSVPVSL